LGPEKITVKKGIIYRAVGPVHVKVEKGKLFVLGFEAGEEEEFLVPRGRVIPFKPIDEGLVSIRAGMGGRVEEAREGEEVIDHWEAECRSLLSSLKGKAVVLVVGSVDVGKSSFCAFISNMALASGFKVAVIDGDIGQADVGPPSCVSLAYVEKRIVTLRGLEPAAMFFVGADTPSGVSHMVVLYLRMLVEEALASGRDLVVVNTDGWVHGYGAKEYKMTLIRAVNPSVVVALQRECEVEHIVGPLKHHRVVRLRSPPAARRRGFEERRGLRESGYFRFLTGSSSRALNAAETPLLYSYLWSGSPMSGDKVSVMEKILGRRITYAECSRDHVLVVTDHSGEVTGEHIGAIRALAGGVRLVKIRHKGFEKGLLVGLLDEKGRCLGIGVIESIDYSGRKLRVLTRYDGPLKYVALGRIKLNDEFKETDKFQGIPL